MTDATREWVLNRSDEIAVEEGAYFSPKHGQDVCDFCERFTVLSKGRWAGQALVLMPWQRSFVMRLYGWRRADGKRRFKRAYLEVAKKNGKTGLMSALSLYHLLADGEGAPEVYCCACDRDQASILFDESMRMIERSPWLKKRCDVIASRKVVLSGHGRLVALSSDYGKHDGINPSAIFFDEVHRQFDRGLWDVMAYASVAREQPLTISITTSGEDEEGIWHEQRSYSESVEAGAIPDTSHLGVIYRAMPEDDLDDPATWRKANPSMGVTISEEDFGRELAEARAVPAKLGNFLRLRLNIVSRGEGKFLELADWDDAPEWQVPDPDAPTYLGLDLSTRDDLTALVGITGDFATGFDVRCKFWLPREGIARLEAQHSVPYRTWADQGFITLTEGASIDYDFVEAAIVRISTTCRLVSLMADPYNGKKLCETLLNQHGLPVFYIRQGYLSLSDPTKFLQELVLSRKLRHGNHPILRWHISNAVARADSAGNLKLDKSLSRRKIDGAAALVNAVAGAIQGGDDGRSVYEERGILVL